MNVTENHQREYLLQGETQMPVPTVSVSPRWFKINTVDWFE